MEKTLYLGIDVGSTTVKIVLLDQSRTLLASRYLRSQGQPRQTLMQGIADVSQHFDLSQVAGVGLTGSGGEPVTQIVGGRHVNELIAQTRAVGAFYPQARTVIEIGGQDSKFLSLEWDETGNRTVLADFAMNSLCAAGTGSFLDQQAERLDISIEDEFSQLALQSTGAARVAGRCTVFAKSDMIHLQQKGTPLPDILAGLCMALARNFKSVIARGKSFTAPILFQGGVAYNQGVVRAFENLLNLAPGELIVPDNHQLMPALGTALVAMDDHQAGALKPFYGFEALEENLRTGTRGEQKHMPPLQSPENPLHLPPVAVGVSSSNGNGNGQHTTPSTGRTAASLGIDVGSVSTKAVLIDEHRNVLAHRYLPTAGKPLEAVRRALRELALLIDTYHIDVRSVGTTGSGRYLTSDFVGADVVYNEITAQARAALAIDPTVDTIFEIGGQDSKYIRLDRGAVVDFAMNNACAAGTGSFLEEQSDRLKIDIKQDFSPLALASSSPTCLGERCTVFMESDIVHHQQQGARLDELTAGLAYAIAQNYLNRVVDGRSIGKNIFFQGGVAWNASIVAAFQQVLQRQITVPPHHDVTGAMGAAILAQEAAAAHTEPQPSSFKGFNLDDRSYESSVFICNACPNLCDVNKVRIEGEPPIFYGARCDKFEEAGRKRQQRYGSGEPLPDLFGERMALLMGDYTPPPAERTGRTRIVMPRYLVFYDMFPYWRTFFNALDVEIVLTDATNPTTISQSLEHAATETCFPVKLAFGHVLNGLEQDVDAIFLPSVINREKIAPGQQHSNYCPYIPASSYIVQANLEQVAGSTRLLSMPFNMKLKDQRLRQLRDLAKELGISSRRVKDADAAAEAAQQEFYAAMRQRGQEVLASLSPEQPVAVLVGRPYNTSDAAVCQNLPFKLLKLGVLPFPMDFLPISTVDISDQYGHMYWRSGQDILASARIIRDDPRLNAIYVTNFSCGPDSFITSYFRRIMGDKPLLELEMDEHTADAGIVTRCEAFFDSLYMTKMASQQSAPAVELALGEQ